MEIIGREMEKKEITIVSPITAAGTTIITISKVRINGCHGKRGIALSGCVQPDNVIIATPSFKKAFRITGEEVAFDQLTQEYPDIPLMLDRK